MLPTNALLPFAHLQLNTIEVNDSAICIQMLTNTPQQCCPQCDNSSARVHSRYPRTVADLSWADLRVQLKLTVRRFFCTNPACPRKIFAGPLGPAIVRYARRTTRLKEKLQRLALLTGGQSAARTAQDAGVTISVRTLLRLAKSVIAGSDTSTATIIGVDDWAWRKGKRYGTIIVDLERRKPIALLKDRSADSFANWLQQNPQVQVISRDRAGAYAEAAQRSAPQAVQVADRFHLVRNLVDALEKLFIRKRAVLKSCAPTKDLSTEGDSDELRAVPAAESTASRADNAVSVARHAKYVELYQRIKTLQAAKVDVANIARQVGVSRGTAYRYLAMEQPPSQRRLYRPPTGKLEPHKPYIVQRWNEGCRSARQIWRELVEKGYDESDTTVSRYVARLRRDSGKPLSFKAVAPRPIYNTNGEEQPRPLSPRQAARLLVSREAKLLAWQSAYLERLGNADSELDTTKQLVAQFMHMVRERQGSALEQWLTANETNAPIELQSFSRSLRGDYAAVEAGLRLLWSNGQTEAQVGRLKMLKRAMNGRAGFDLLRQRVLYRPQMVQQVQPKISAEKSILV